MLGHASTERAHHSAEFQHGMASQYHCECIFCGPERRNGASYICTFHTRTKFPYRSQRTFPFPGSHPCREQVCYSFPKSIITL